MNRIARRHTGHYHLTATVTDPDGSPATVDDPAIEVFDGAEASVWTGTPSATEGELSINVPVGELEQLDTYKAVWTGSIGGEGQEWHTAIELCGAHIYELPDFRARDVAFENRDKYPDVLLRGARIWAEQRFEGAAGVAFVNRGKREVLAGDGTRTLLVAEPALKHVVSCSLDGEAIDTDDLVAWEDGRVMRPLAWKDGARVDIHYVHGYDRPPAPVRNAVMLLAREVLVASALSSRAVTETTDVGFIRLQIAAAGGRIGIPEVDAVAADYGRHRPAVG